MAKNIRKNSKKTATSGSADGRLDVKALARAVGLSFDGLALSPTGRSALNTAPDQAAGQSEQHDRLAGGKPQITNGPDVARSAGVETGNNAGDNAVGRGNIADRVADTKPTGFETGHSTPGAAGSAASQSLINGLAVAENVAARPSDGGRAAGATDINALESGAPGQAGSGTSGSDFVRFAVGTGTAAAPAACEWHCDHDRYHYQSLCLDADRGLERQLRVHGDAVGRLARRDDDPHRPGRHHDRRRRHHRHADDCRRQRRGRVPGRLQPDGARSPASPAATSRAWSSAPARPPPTSPTPSPTRR